MCLAAHVSGELKSRSTRGPGSRSNSGGHASPASERGHGWSPLHGHEGESGRQPRGAWSRLVQLSGGQGAHREGAEGLAENHRVVINGSCPDDEPVGQRRGRVEPARWRRRRVGSSPACHGVCGRHGGEEAWVTPGDLLSSERQVWSTSCDTRRRKGGQPGTPTSTWSHQEVGVDRSASEVPAEAVPGVGAGCSPQERGPNKRPRLVAGSCGAAGRKRSDGGGRPRAWLQVGGGAKRRVRAGRVERSMCERPHPRAEATATPQNPPASGSGQGKKQKVHARIDKVFSRKNLELAWAKVKKNRGSARGDDVTIGQFEARQEHYLDLLHRKLRDGTCRPQAVKRVEIPKSEGGVRKLGRPGAIGCASRRWSSGWHRASNSGAWTAPLGIARGARPMTRCARVGRR